MTKDDKEVVAFMVAVAVMLVIAAVGLTLVALAL